MSLWNFNFYIINYISRRQVIFIGRATTQNFNSSPLPAPRPTPASLFLTHKRTKTISLLRMSLYFKSIMQLNRISQYEMGFVTQ